MLGIAEEQDVCEDSKLHLGPSERQRSSSAARLPLARGSQEDQWIVEFGHSSAARRPGYRPRPPGPPLVARRSRANPLPQGRLTRRDASRRRGYQGSSGSGGARAGAGPSIAGGSVGRPRCARIFWIAPWSRLPRALPRATAVRTGQPSMPPHAPGLARDETAGQRTRNGIGSLMYGAADAGTISGCRNHSLFRSAGLSGIGSDRSTRSSPGVPAKNRTEL